LKRGGRFSPSPRPSPLGRGRIVDRACANPERLDLSQRGMRCSLSLGAFYYPHFHAHFPWQIFHMSDRSLRRWSPRQSVIGPGSPSLLRARKPPNCAAHRTKSRTEGGFPGGRLWPKVTHHSACHSGLLNQSLAGALGVSRAALHTDNNRQATTKSTAKT